MTNEESLTSIFLSRKEARRLASLLSLVASDPTSYALLDKIENHYNICDETFEKDLDNMEISKDNDEVVITFKEEEK